MKILVVSDTHVETIQFQSVLDKHKDADMKIHCGDSELKVDDPLLSGFYVVQGNCDKREMFQNEQVVMFENMNIFITHGHLYKVKQTLLPISLRAKEIEAKIVCFGHSHRLGIEEREGMIFLNPGSLNFPRGRSEGTYVIIDVKENEFEITCWSAEHTRLCCYTFQR